MWKSFKYGYEVSSSDEVRSLGRVVIGYDGRKVSLKGVTLKQQIDNNGYKRVSISIDGVKITMKVHRIVAAAFLENPLNLPCVNHKDGNKSNNTVDNLEWVSYSENTMHAYKNGLINSNTKSNHPMYTGDVLAIDSRGEVVARMSGSMEMREHGFDFRLVSAVLKGKRKTHKGCTFVKLNKEN